MIRKLALFLLLLNAPVFAQEKPVYLDPSQPLEARVNDFLPRLNLEEKISLLHGNTQFSTAPLTRFNIPDRWMSDGPQGVREEINRDNFRPAGRTDDFATAMPADIALAASFDPDLAKDYGSVIGEEAVARGKNIMLGPAINIMRTPLNGRNSEYFGEDPYLASRMTVGYINGEQSHGIASCVKHYAANNQEQNRNTVNVEMDDRTLHEIYLPAFKAAITEAHSWAIMTAYNKFRGSYCSENDLLLNQILKTDWKFPGLVMSDWGGVHSTVNAAMNGLDLEMGTSGPYEKWFFAQPLLDAVHEGKVPEARINEMARRNLRVMFATGMFDPADSRPKGSLSTPEHATIARRIAESGIVLLKNDVNLLPLNPAQVKSIAVIGANADTKFAHDGNSAQIKTSYEITPLEGITKRAGENIKVTYSVGYNNQVNLGGRGRGRGAATASAPALAPPSTQSAALVDAAVEAAKNADIAIVVAGLYRRFDQEGADRRDLQLPPGQLEVIQAVTAVNPRTIVILNGGGPLEMDAWLPKANAVLFYWYGGTEGGNALARILFGDVTPSGKLPCSFPRQLADSPAHALDAYPGVMPAPAPTPAATGPAGRPSPNEEYKEGLLVGYRWYDTKKIQPLFPFGYGLSYNIYQYTNLKLTTGDVTKPNSPVVTAEFDIVNNGGRDGAEAIQVYIHPVNPAVTRPDQELKAFRKINFTRGQRQKVSIPLDASAFAYYDPAKKAWVADKGEYEIRIGASSRDIRLHSDFSLAQAITIPEAQ